jgi:crotonobetainyl-CoA:carnitine CoA-transferase CaiB-like acyl-CoA transferase
MAGTHLAQGILATLYQRGITGEGALVQVSMFESILDFQFETLTCFYNDGNELPVRSSVNNGHAYIAAPYGIYQTSDGFLALAMGNIPVLAQLLKCDELLSFTEPRDWFTLRDEIKTILANHLRTQNTSFWLSVLEPADIWCAKVLDYDSLTKEEGYAVLNMEVKVKTSNGIEITTTRCPIRVDGELLLSQKGAPFLGEHTEKIRREFLNKAVLNG